MTAEDGARRVEALEEEVRRLRERLDAVDLDDLARSSKRMRELLFEIGELIEQSLSRA